MGSEKLIIKRRELSPMVETSIKAEKIQRKEEKKMPEQGFGADKVALEYINFMRNSFRTSMESTKLMQEEGERLLGMLVKQGQTGYEEGSKILNEWTDNYKKASDQFKSNIEASLAKLEELVTKKD